MLKLKLQYFGHLMRRADSVEKTLMLGKIEGRRRRGWQRMGWLDGITNSKDMNLSKLHVIVKDGEPGMLQGVPGITKSGIHLSNWTMNNRDVLRRDMFNMHISSRMISLFLFFNWLFKVTFQMCFCGRSNFIITLLSTFPDNWVRVLKAYIAAGNCSQHPSPQGICQTWLMMPGTLFQSLSFTALVSFY